MANSSTCTRCNIGSEDALHALHDCSKAKSVWMRLVKPCHWPMFFGAEFNDWLLINLSRKMGIDGGSDPLFTILHRVRNCIADFGSMIGNVKRKPNRVNKIVKWIPPDIGWVKVNVDGASSKIGDHRASYGVVIRYDRGNYIVGFMRNLGADSPLQAELWGVYSGLLTAWHHGYQRIIIDMDSLVACEMIKNMFPQYSHVLHTYREANFAADAMTVAAFQSSNCLTFMEEPPLEVISAMEAYMSGLGVSRVAVV
ncbi:ribonuclease H [Senna tora]|uniref:Ribonuclease H n=1 Tax=Senna tora TaxID=362788 RepID=A0A834WC43_9FABA|nr:ribonuclease H [Senna tora]